MTIKLGHVLMKRLMQDTSSLNELKALLPRCCLQDQLRIGARLARWLTAGSESARSLAPVRRWLAEARASVVRRQERHQRLPRLTYPDLPITAWREDIVEAIRAHQVLVIAGETGSGKTTQLPKMLLEAGLGVRARIGCTQPRRVAAVSLARRLAEELAVTPGRDVGCKIRFTDETSRETLVKFMTDGILLAEMQRDVFLSEYEALIIDEAHERSLNIDFLLGHLKQLLPQRTDLKVLITSATIDTQAFSNAFNQAPIIEVSGRLFPVEVRYAPISEPAEQHQAEGNYVEAAVAAVEALLAEPGGGDVLVFLPGERDIMEARSALQQGPQGAVEVIPLFGRLSAEDQQRVFSPTPRRRVVLATNLAETSLTVPRIRYVVDTGLARISRYNPRTRTRRLPIEPISQSSANQRQGRCGRVAAGICVRLYSEADYHQRPLYTEPEIQRANLAEVILRMRAFELGDIETFPFLNPPRPQAIQGGYQLLVELGALDADRRVTDLGWELAHLPIDPTIGRMILQARREGALREVLIIAAGLSVQDPRERPLAQPETAANAQRRFHDPRSDFLSLLNLWNAYHETLESLKTQGQMRKFCQAHFLSYLRMREWRDIHAQLEEVLDDLDGTSVTTQPASYEAIHRSILTGLWGHIACREQGNFYRLAGNRSAMVFPGSGLFLKGVRSPPGRPSPATASPAAASESRPVWIVAGEIFETSRLFLRNVAEINPRWIVELGAHLCQRKHQEPHWDPRSGRVLATERITLNGLPVLQHVVSFQRVDAAQAAEIFVRSALVEEGLREHLTGSAASKSSAGPRETAQASSPGTLPPPFHFLDHNQQFRQKLELWQTGRTHRVVPDLTEAIYRFYAERLSHVASVHDLNRFLRESSGKDQAFLHLSAEALLGEQGRALNLEAFPDRIALGDSEVCATYAYAPGEERDGVTLKLPFTLAQVIDAKVLDWAVPGLREPQILHLLQALPKDLRRALTPLPAKAKLLASQVVPQGSSLLPQLSECIRHHYGIEVPLEAWSMAQLPAYLRPRLEILGRDQAPLAAGRDLDQLRTQLQQHATPAESAAWQQAVQRWERYGLTEWNFGDLPGEIRVSDIAGFPWNAYPALQVEDQEVGLRLFARREEALVAQRLGIPALAAKVMQRELGWLQKDLRALDKLKPLWITLAPADALERDAFQHLLRYALPPREPPTFRQAEFGDYVADGRQRLQGIVPRLTERLEPILRLRQELLLHRRPYPGLRPELDALVPAQFLQQIPFDRLPHLSRYLKALQIRADRAALNPAKDAEKARRIQPFVIAWRALMEPRETTPEIEHQLQDLRWGIEEYKVSCFAQELGTAEPVSAARLQRLVEEIQRRVAARNKAARAGGRE